MMLIFLLISSLITKYRQSDPDSNVRREDQRISKKIDKKIKHPSLGKKGHRVHKEGVKREGGGLKEGDHQGHGGPMVRWGQV
jgi:hypothetical protein